MLDRQLRQLKDAILVPAADVVGARVHPTTLTAAGLAVGLACAVVAAQGAYTIGLVLWLLNRLLDGLDGTVARRSGRQTDLGAYLDLLADFAVYAAVPVGLAVSVDDRGAYIALALMLSAFYINAAGWMVLSALLEKRRAGVKSTGEQTGITMPTGLIEGTETFAAYVLFFLLPDSLVLLFAGFALLVMVTVIQRILWALRNL